jgi:CheY-like chemotaxis protein
VLVSQGHTVVAAGSGPDALRTLGEDAGIDVVITDLVMPTMTGWELVDAVKASRPTLRIGVVTGRAGGSARHPGGRRLRALQAADARGAR